MTANQGDSSASRRVSCGTNCGGGTPSPASDFTFGGELPLGCDPLAVGLTALGEDCLRFSHVRGALAWLLGARGPFCSALLCAYTCPELVTFCRDQGLSIGLFDVGEPDPAALAADLPGPCLLVLPALLGGALNPDPAEVADRLGGGGMVVVDAAQTAFGHLWCRLPPGGAVVSGPRKVTGLGDGAVLRLDGVTAAERAAVEALPVAYGPLAAKLAGRAMMVERSPAAEDEMLALFRRAESAWPATPHRMSGHSRDLLARLDPHAHAERRRANRDRLAAGLEGWVEMVAVSDGVPFNLSVLVEPNRRAGLLAKLGEHRVFATPLWPDSLHDADRHPRAARLAAGLVGLPIDQRYSPGHMDELARRVRQCLPR